jgi:Carbohydrate kinase
VCLTGWRPYLVPAQLLRHVRLQAVADKLGGPVLVAKGAVDTVSSVGSSVLTSDEEGAPRRCGGQGDLLSGVLGTTISWAVAYARKQVCTGLGRQCCALVLQLPLLLLLLNRSLLVMAESLHVRNEQCHGSAMPYA